MLDVCAQMTTNLCLQGRTNVYEAWDSNFGASTKVKEENSDPSEV